jgi:hypothetical protein
MGFSYFTGGMVLSFAAIESFSSFDFQRYRTARRFWDEMELLMSAADIAINNGVVHGYTMRPHPVNPPAPISIAHEAFLIHLFMQADLELAALVAPRLAQPFRIRGSLYRCFRLGVVVSGHLGCHGLSNGAGRYYHFAS